MNYKMFLKT